MCDHCGEYRQRTVRVERKIEEQQLIIMAHAMVGPEMMNDNFSTDEYVENVAEKIEQLDKLAKAAAKAVAES